MKRVSFTVKLTAWYACFMAVSFVFTWFLFKSSADRASEAYYRDELREAVSIARLNAVYENGYLDFEPMPDALENLHVSYFTPEGSLLYGHICADTVLSPGDFSLAYDDYERHRAILDEWIDVEGYGKVIVRASISMKDAESITDRVSGAMLALIPVTLLVSLMGGYVLLHRAIRPVKRISHTARSIVSGEDLKKRIDKPAAEDEIGVLTGVINDMLSRLEKAFEREKRFTGDISHELRTPVAAIISLSESALQAADAQEEKTNALIRIREKSVSMGKMIGNLLMLSRMDAGKIALEKEEADLKDIAESTLEDVLGRYEEKNLRVSARLEPAKAVCDPMLIACLLLNLTENAFRYTSSGGEIEITTCEDQNRAVFVIENRGAGMKKEDAEHIFDRFYTVSRLKGSGGNGLGLSIAKSIANLHGAELKVESDEDTYVRFTLILPG